MTGGQIASGIMGVRNGHNIKNMLIYQYRYNLFLKPIFV
jgi:hypothetical protein